MKNPENDNIGQLLRDVEIPSGLKNRLHQVTVEETQLSSTEQPKSYLTVAMVTVLAAALSGVALAVFWFAPKPGAPVANVAEKPSELEYSDGANILDTNQLLAQLSKDASRIDLLASKLKLAKLEQQIARLKSKSSTNLMLQLESDSYGISNVETTSLILAMSEQFALCLGADSATVKRDLQSIVERFPETSGARMAHELLDGEL